MVAITTDTHHRRAPVVAVAAGVEHVPARPRANPASGGDPAGPAVVVARLLAVVLALLVVVAVATGAAAMGRVLDAQRGIPAASSPADLG